MMEPKRTAPCPADCYSLQAVPTFVFYSHISHRQSNSLSTLTLFTRLQYMLLIGHRLSGDPSKSNLKKGMRGTMTRRTWLFLATALLLVAALGNLGNAANAALPANSASAPAANVSAQSKE